MIVKNGNGDFIAHYGVKGMKWGVRRATTRGSTPPSKRKAEPKQTGKVTTKAPSSKKTPASKKETGPIHAMSDAQLRAKIQRIELERKLNKLMAEPPKPKSRGRQVAENILYGSAEAVGKKIVTNAAEAALGALLPGIMGGGGKSSKGGAPSASDVKNVLSDTMKKTAAAAGAGAASAPKPKPATPPAPSAPRKPSFGGGSKSDPGTGRDTRSANAAPSTPLKAPSFSYSQQKPSASKKDKPKGNELVRMEWETIDLGDGSQLQIPKIKHSEIAEWLGEDYLAHYGVKGMKWGVNKRAMHNRYSYQGVHRRSGKLLIKPRGFRSHVPILRRTRKASRRKTQKIIDSIDMGIRLKDVHKEDRKGIAEDIGASMRRRYYQDMETVRSNKKTYRGLKREDREAAAEAKKQMKSRAGRYVES